MLTNREAFNKAKQCQKIAVGSIYEVFFGDKDRNFI